MPVSKVVEPPRVESGDLALLTPPVRHEAKAAPPVAAVRPRRMGDLPPLSSGATEQLATGLPVEEAGLTMSGED